MPFGPTLTSFLWFHVRSFKGWAGAHFGPCFSVATVANDSASRCAPTQEKVSHAYRDLCEQNSIDVHCTILNVSCAPVLSNSSLFCFLIPVLSHSPDCTATVCTSLSTPRSFSTALLDFSTTDSVASANDNRESGRALAQRCVWCMLAIRKKAIR